MKKRKLKLFSILLSLILVVVSVPMAVVAEEVDTSEVSEIVTEIQEGLEDVTISDDFLEIQDDFADINSVASASTSEQITYLPDGIYAFESSRVPGYYMTVSGSGTTANQNIKQSPFAISPSLQYNEYALFKLTRISGTNRYSIRLILNSNLSLTLGANGTDVVTAEIPQNDSDLTQSQTFEILHNSYGYMFRSCETQKFISVNGTSEANLKFSGAVNNSICWIPHGYSTYIEDGVYAFSNNGNLGLWMDTQNNSYLSSKHAQQYAYTTCPADSFSRGGLFKVTQIGTSGRYIIRLMTNNCLTWKCGAVNGDVLSYEIPSNDSNVSVLLTYKIVYDTNGFVLIPFRTTNAITATPNSTASGAGGAPESYLTVTSAFSITDSARWSMYKYTGSIRSGATMISNESTSEMGSKGAIVDSTYTLKMVVWTTELSMNLVSFNISPADTRIADITTYADTYTADMAVNNVGKLVLYFTLSKFTGSAPMTLYSATYTYNSVPKLGTYYIQNSQYQQYVNVMGPSMNEGTIIHQLGFSTENRFKWEIEHVEGSGGYIRFKSLYSGLYIGVDPSNSSRIRQYSTTSDNTLWRFELLDDYTVKIICKASESSGTVLSAPLNAGSGVGEWLTQRAYTDDSDYSDEWMVSPNRYQFYISHYYDIGYSIRFNEFNPNTDELISSYQDYVSEVFATLFDVEIKYNCYSYTSPIDTCKLSTYGSINFNNLSEECIHFLPNSNSTDPLHATRTALKESLNTGNEILSIVIWTGHILNGNPGSVAFNYTVVMTPHHTTSSINGYPNKPQDKVYYHSILSLMHELSHQIGAKDHYCKKGITDVGPCSNMNCDKCHNGYQETRKCIMADGDELLFTDNDLYCSECITNILTHLNEHH